MKVSFMKTEYNQPKAELVSFTSEDILAMSMEKGDPEGTVTPGLIPEDDPD